MVKSKASRSKCIMSEKDIFATSSSTELLAFYGSLFAIAAADID
ncbi:hypothetical protein [Tychonema sp. LEGE 07203]|nr:hypothetical protein [Tychonema sp. LEGE 07203]